MKIINKVSIAVVVCFTTLLSVNAQNALLDPALSSNNYKHPNKASKAREVRKNREMQSVQEEYVRPVTHSKAKTRFNRVIPITLTTNFRSQSIGVERNYKQSFKPIGRINEKELIEKFFNEMK